MKAVKYWAIKSSAGSAPFYWDIISPQRHGIVIELFTTKKEAKEAIDKAYLDIHKARKLNRPVRVEIREVKVKCTP